MPIPAIPPAACGQLYQQSITSSVHYNHIYSKWGNGGWSTHWAKYGINSHVAVTCGNVTVINITQGTLLWRKMYNAVDIWVVTELEWEWLFFIPTHETIKRLEEIRHTQTPRGISDQWWMSIMQTFEYFRIGDTGSGAVSKNFYIFIPFDQRERGSSSYCS